jgi:hypothetical protein
VVVRSGAVHFARRRRSWLGLGWLGILSRRWAGLRGGGRGENRHHENSAKKSIHCLNLTKLDLILPELTAISMRTSWRFPEAIAIWMQNRRGWGAFILPRQAR